MWWSEILFLSMTHVSSKHEICSLSSFTFPLTGWNYPWDATYYTNLWQEWIFHWIEIIVLCLVDSTEVYSKNKNKEKYSLANSNCIMINSQKSQKFYLSKTCSFFLSLKIQYTSGIFFNALWRVLFNFFFPDKGSTS